MDSLKNIISVQLFLKLALSIFICLLIIFILRRIVKKYVGKKISSQSRMILLKIISFIGFSVLVIVTIDQLGLKSLFKTMLGTAGIVGVAIGFASKTSLENIISGLLLLTDKSFKVGDIIVVGDKEGTVEAIDSLSVKIRTYNNQLVRIPNVKILNSDLTNLYPNNEKRKDFYFNVSYKSNLEKVKELLIKIAKNNPYAIKTDETFIYFYSFEDLGYKIKYGVWFKKGDITLLCNSIVEDMSKLFKEEGIEIPVPLLNKSK